MGFKMKSIRRLYCKHYWEYDYELQYRICAKCGRYEKWDRRWFEYNLIRMVNRHNKEDQYE